MKAAQDMIDAGHQMTEGELSFLEAVLEQKVEHLDESFYELESLFKSGRKIHISLVNTIIQVCLFYLFYLFNVFLKKKKLQTKRHAL